MSKALSRMNKNELTAEANRHGYEVEESDTLAVLREIVAALREEAEAGIDQGAPITDPESTEGDDSPEGDSTPTHYTRAVLEAMGRDEVAAIAWDRYGIEDPQHLAITKDQFIDKILETQSEPSDDTNSDQNGDATIDVIQTGESTFHEAPGENQLRVRVSGNKGTTVLWERHRFHPGGEVFLRGGMTAVVGDTPAVGKLIGTKLVEVEREHTD